MTISLIISTYNWHEALELVLISVIKQSKMPDEIIIADDGSDNKTKKIIDSFKKKTSCPIIHVWQKDRGFRKTSILNKAIKISTSSYHIEIDGDIILHKDFIFDHYNFAEKGSFIQGSRVLLGKNLTAEIFSKKQTSFNCFMKDITNRINMIRWPIISMLFSKKKLNITSVRGCNISYWREDMIAINGYNEKMTGWGREDSEMVTRLINKGIFKRKLKFAGITYHLYHEINSRTSLNINDQILYETINNKAKYCKHGINNMLN